MTLHGIINSVLSSIGQQFVEPGRKPPANDEYLSLVNAAENFLREIYQEVVGIAWPNLPRDTLRERIGWPGRMRRLRHGIADAGACADAFVLLLARELANRQMGWPTWEWPE